MSLTDTEHNELRAALVAKQGQSAELAAQLQSKHAEYVSLYSRYTALGDEITAMRRELAGEPEVAARPMAAAPLIHQPTVERPISPPRARAHIPMSVVLQGTGALLLLAALVVGSAVLWDVLPPAAQIVALVSGVALVGFAAVAAGKHIPSTGLVLSALTAASGVVVAGAIPTIQPSLASDAYPLTGFALGTVILLGFGHGMHNQLWWRAGLGLAAVTAGVAVDFALTQSALEPGTPAWFAAWTISLAAIGAAFQAVANRTAGSDTETARSSTTIALLVLFAMTGTLLALAGNWLADLNSSNLAWSARAWSAAAGLAAAAAFWGFGEAAGRTHGLSPVAARRASAAVVGPLPVLMLVPNTVTQALPALAVALLIVAAAVLLLQVVGAAPGAHAPSAAAAFALASLLAQGALYSGADPGSHVWLLVLGWGVGAGVATVLAGLARRILPLVVIGTAITATYWLWSWLGGNLPDPVEAVSLPIGAAAVASWWSAERRGLLSGRAADPRTPQLLVVASAVPSTIASLADQLADDLSLPSISAIVGCLLIVALIAARTRSGWTIPVAATAAIGVAHIWAAASDIPAAAAEWISIPAALGVGAVTGAGVLDGWTTPRRAGVATTIPVLVLSGTALILQPEWSMETALRLALVVAAALVATAYAWHRPGFAWMFGTVAVAAPLWVYLASVDWPPAAPEVVTLPLAAAAGASFGLLMRTAEDSSRGANDSIGSWWSRAWRAAGLIALALSALMASTVATLGHGEPLDWIRFGVVIVGLTSMAWLVREHRLASAALGSAAVVVVWANVLALLADRISDPAIELVTLPSAAAVGAIAALGARAWPAQHSSLLWLAPPAALALLPTAALAWQDGTAGWRVWAALAAGSATLIVGVRRETAGLVYVGLVGVALVVVPVLLQFVTDAPTWVPLSLAGAALLLVGARLEWTRRTGRDVMRWAAHLH